MTEAGGTRLPEITSPVDLCAPSGRLNPAAIGWTRRPLHSANLRGRGRNKRWEYWAVMSADHILAITVSDLDYATLHAVYARGPAGSEVAQTALQPLGRVTLPPSSGSGPVHVSTKDLSIDIRPDRGGVDLRVRTPRVIADVRVDRPAGHEALGVVVPWSDRRFQHTVKENTLPAHGTLVVDGHASDLGDDCWATLDHGRGRWPYRVTWNWGSGSGRVGTHAIGVQVGGRWTDSTGSTENALCVDGRLHYVDEDLVWSYDRGRWLQPWRVRSPLSDRVDLVFTPGHVRTDRTNLGILANDTHQAFGTWAGHMSDDSGRRIRVDGIRGWAEEVVNRW